MLTTAQTAKLERLAHFATRYELALTLADGRRYLVAYCGRKSRQGMLAAIRDRGPAILAKLPPEAANGEMAWKAGRFAFTGGSTIGWTCRTQREAIAAGELPYVAEGK